MLNRIFKTILVLSICVGISLPTNAAVSVSDGSAFVTKAEFAADLNNLSNRMAQLENSLDAKIDSLVSSYLTRNGIWNGAKQQLDTYYVVDVIGQNSAIPSKHIDNGYRSFIGESRTYDCTHYGKIIVPTTELNSSYLEVKSERATYTVVSNISKSGLLYMTVNIAPTSLLWTDSANSLEARCWVSFAPSSSTGSTFTGSFVKWFFEFSSNGVMFSQINGFQEGMGRPSGSGIYDSEALWYKLGYLQSKVLTFVSKGDDITLKDYMVFKRNTASGTFKSTVDTPTVSGLILTIDDCSVY